MTEAMDKSSSEAKTQRHTEPSGLEPTAKSLKAMSLTTPATTKLPKLESVRVATLANTELV
jgi:hypothetical protein